MRLSPRSVLGIFVEARDRVCQSQEPFDPEIAPQISWPFNEVSPHNNLFQLSFKALMTAIPLRLLQLGVKDLAPIVSKIRDEVIGPEDLNVVARSVGTQRQEAVFGRQIDAVLERANERMGLKLKLA